jgi:hypothetical protein
MVVTKIESFRINLSHDYRADYFLALRFFKTVIHTIFLAAGALIDISRAAFIAACVWSDPHDEVRRLECRNHLCSVL